MKTAASPRAPAAPRVHLSAKELKEYSIGQAVRCAEQRALGFSAASCLELEVSGQIQRAADYSGRGEGIAFLYEGLAGVSGADGASGGYLTSPGLPAAWQSALSRGIAPRMGVNFHVGLRGRNELPLPSGESTPGMTWVDDSQGDGEAPEIAQQKINLMSLSPRVAAGYVDVSRQMRKNALYQVGGIDSMLRAEFSAAVSAAIDYALFAGVGGILEPLGILNDSDVELVTLGDNGASLTRSGLIDMLHALGAANAFDGLAFVSTNNVRTRMMRTIDSLTTGVAWTWGAPLGGADGSVLESVPAWVSAAVPDDLTKGSGTDLSGAILGRWSDAVVGIWGDAFELLVDPGALVKSGGLRVVCLVDVDAGARRKGSFVRCVDIATT